MHAYIIQQLIRIILFITIGLPIGLKSFAQETKRFYMELDTPRNGDKAGQELELKYISKADFDSVSPPDFGTLIETVEGATPHKAGHTVKNGILTDIYEQGFSYRIRFKKPGNTKLPLASIKASTLMFVTADSMCKLVSGTEFDVAKRTIASTKLAEEDTLVFVCSADEMEQVVLQSTG